MVDNCGYAAKLSSDPSDRTEDRGRETVEEVGVGQPSEGAVVDRRQGLCSCRVGCRRCCCGCRQRSRRLPTALLHNDFPRSTIGNKIDSGFDNIRCKGLW